MGVKQWLGIGGSSDGTATGTFSIWKVASGIGSVVETSAATSLARLTSILAQLDVALSTRASEATLTTIDADTGAIKTATEKVATETGVGTGLLVRQPTAGNFNCTEASAGAMKTAVEKMDDWDAVHDAAAGSDGVRLMGTAYADPSALPADVTANGDDARVAVNRKGVVYTSDAYLGFAEDATRGVMRVERQGTASGRLAASAAVVAAGTAGRMYGIIIDGGAGGITVNLRADGVVGGAILHQFVVGVNTYASIDLLDFPYANGLYGEIAAGGGGFNVHYRNT